MAKRPIVIDPNNVGLAYHRKSEGNPIEIGGRVVGGAKSAIDRYATVRFAPADAVWMAVAMLGYAAEVDPAALREKLQHRAVKRPYDSPTGHRETAIAQALLDALYGIE